ncbi:MAG: tRNA dihydrouridine(20/20a) synthase DusA [Pseudomonadales bacterium]
MNQPDPKLTVAPMMAWTDRHCRFLLRQYAPHALLFTEMVTTGALLHGQQWHLLDHDPAEHPLALQLGGNDPGELADCASEAAKRGYDEVNLNVGCPSDRVQKGTFGACLMREPQLVADCVAAMQARVDIPVTVKCRLGVDDYDSDELLHGFVGTLADAGCRRIYLHARKAILAGLSPAQNREIPPLQVDRVARLKRTFAELEIIVNGGITEIATVQSHLAWADGVMIGRAAYHNPDLLSECERAIFDASFAPDKQDIVARYVAYMGEQLARGVKLHSLTRHLLSSCNGMPGARKFRRTLSDAKRLQTGDLSIVDDAMAHVFRQAA